MWLLPAKTARCVQVSSADTCACLLSLPCPQHAQFNAGSAGSAGAVAGQAFLNTNSAAASSMLTFMLLVSEAE